MGCANNYLAQIQISICAHLAQIQISTCAHLAQIQISTCAHLAQIQISTCVHLTHALSSSARVQRAETGDISLAHFYVPI